ncbi:MAG: ATP-dependent DNA helicase RecG [Alistipes sp.]|nr:ATP-dependent DNA helicase RecG [Alistipes sp.]
MNPLDNDIKYISGVGEVRAKLLAKEIGVKSVGDMLYHFPFRYVDRTKVYNIGELNEANTSGGYIQIRGRVTGKNIFGEGRNQRFVIYIADQTGKAELIWFRGIKWIENKFELGREYLVFGRPSFYRSELSFVHPEVEPIEVAMSRKENCGLQGIYSTTEKLSTAMGAKGMHTIVGKILDSYADKIVDYMPDYLRQQYGLIPLAQALETIHRPTSPMALKQAQFRLKFDELFGIQLNIQSRRAARTTAQAGFHFGRVGKYFNDFYNTRLPFPLTGAQKKAIKDIRADTVSGCQMNRLLQGDVGSGKTVVALISMILAVDNGFQACIMAPTEILARQHYATIVKMVGDIGLRIAVLTGTTKSKERREILAALVAGEIDILVGTHALIEDRVQFASLGFVVIDEQHRFGVEQRAKLWAKNTNPPHILVMTATPIPRTLAMTLYGDLDVSTIDELPPGRKPIKTVHYYDSARLRLFGFMREQIAQGRQIYIVYPLIKESEKADYANLEQGFEAIVRDFPLPKYRVTACHGKMKPEDKEESMRQFKSGEADILVATSVIEVGVDIPNASVMVIESAERFGLAQLHQLRGRVGRGANQSYCVLMSDEKLSKESRARLEAMCETNNGFRLAELDLQLRGAGDINGTQQSGEIIDLKIANLAEDNQIVQLAQQAAIALLTADANLELPQHIPLRELRARYTKRESVDFSVIL